MWQGGVKRAGRGNWERRQGEDGRGEDCREIW